MASDHAREAREFVETKPAAPPQAAEEKLKVEPAWAVKCAQAFFWPLAKYDHPAWTLTDEEAQKISPDIERFLQAVSDRYFPGWASHLYLRHRELWNFLSALVLLYYAKYKVVEAVRRAEQKAAHGPVRPVAINTREPVSDEESEPLTCELCGKPFPDRVAFAVHLPCPGRIV